MCVLVGWRFLWLVFYELKEFILLPVLVQFGPSALSHYTLWMLQVTVTCFSFFGGGLLEFDWLCPCVCEGGGVE